MKKTIIAMAILLASAGTASFAQTTKPTTTKHSKTAGVKYTCTMHPEVMSNKPGKCPKCGMALVPVKKHDSKKDTVGKKSMDGMKM